MLITDRECQSRDQLEVGGAGPLSFVVEKPPLVMVQKDLQRAINLVVLCPAHMWLGENLLIKT
jgi:hypothetical protein